MTQPETSTRLWVPPPFAILRFRGRTRTVTLPDGRHAKVTVDDSGTVTQIESGRRGSGVSERLDGIVRPTSIRIHLSPSRSSRVPSR